MKAFRWTVAAILFAGLITALGIGARQSPLEMALQSSFRRTFACLVLLLAPLWFFGFSKRLAKDTSEETSEEASEDASDNTITAHSSWLLASLRVMAAGMLGAPYFALTAGTHFFYWRAAIIVVALPVLLAAFLAMPKLSERMTWRDVAALLIIVAAYFLNWLRPAWPSPAMAALPKLFLADVALYCFLVIRKIRGSGYSLLPTFSSVAIGMREGALYLPMAFILGEATGFIHFHHAVPGIEKSLAAILVTFLCIALPEELFFRAIWQNLLETRMGRLPALITAAALFGLSHFNHGARFNWRYVLLAGIAGIFYGRAWRARRQVLSSVVTHTLVDVVWSLWFR